MAKVMRFALLSCELAEQLEEAFQYIYLTLDATSFGQQTIQHLVPLVFYLEISMVTEWTQHCARGFFPPFLVSMTTV